ncbi:GLUG motif-containing protein [Lactococcus muris]|uniref:GLUG motif-containing protein n=1 Tax=Lactococcus muris TaxID=2941330 RepID=A0ABV4D9X7_9LACT
MKKEKILSGLLLTTLILGQTVSVFATGQDILQNQVQNEAAEPTEKDDNAQSEKAEVVETETESAAAVPKEKEDVEESQEVKAEAVEISAYAAGTGTETDPYQIANEAQLNQIRDDLPNSGTEGIYYKLTASFPLTSPWIPIGDSSAGYFRGHFDGNNQTISNLSVNSDSYLGLFGIAENASFKNLTIGAAAVSGSTELGILAGRLTGSQVTNVHVSGTVTGTSSEIGGLIGLSRNTAVATSSANVTVSGSGRYVGGLIGHNQEDLARPGASTITDTTSSGSVQGTTAIDPGDSTSGSFSVGGLIGFNERANVINSSSSATVSNVAFATGGLIGENISTHAGEGLDTNRGQVLYSSATGNVSGTGQGTDQLSERVGGLIGQNGDIGGSATGRVGGNVIGSSATGRVSSTGQHAGGLIGFNAAEGKVIENSHYSSSNSVEGLNDVGGLIGNNRYADVKNTSAAAVVSAYDTSAAQDQADIAGKYVGGLIGRNSESLVEQSRATGGVSGQDYVAGLIGATGPASTGSTERTTVSSSWASGAVTGRGNYIGGLIGRTAHTTTSNSFATGNVSAPTSGSYEEGYQVGGLVGQAGTGSILEQNYATGNVTAQSQVGGLIGRLENSTLSRNWAKGDVTAANNAGGLIGNSYGSTQLSQVNDAYAIGDVTATGNNVGGLIGSMSPTSFSPGSYGTTVVNAYASGDVTGASNVGGLIGGSDFAATLSNAVAIGQVTGTGQVGGVVGNATHITMSDIYRWDYMQVNGEVLDRHINNASEKDGGLASARELRMENSYVNLTWVMGTAWKWSTVSGNPAQITSPIQHWPVLGFGPEEDTFPHYSIAGTDKGTKMYDGEEVVRDSKSLFTPEYAQLNEFDYTLNGQPLNLENKLVLADDVALHEIRAVSKLTPLQTSTGHRQDSGNFPGRLAAQADYEITPRPLLYTDKVWLERQYNGQATMNLQNSRLTSEDWTALAFDHEALTRAEVPGVISGDEVRLNANTDFQHLLSGNHSLDGVNASAEVGEGVLLHNLTPEQMAQIFSLAGSDAHNYTLKTLENVNTRVTAKDEKVPESSEGKAKEKEILPATGEAANIAFLTLGFAAVFTALMLWFKHHLAQRK